MMQYKYMANKEDSQIDTWDKYHLQHRPATGNE